MHGRQAFHQQSRKAIRQAGHQRRRTPDYSDQVLYRSITGTFSIVARDPATGDLGVAVQSKVLAVGHVVPWARAGVGAVATQALHNYEYGSKGLELMAGGKSAADALAQLLGSDSVNSVRQVALMDAGGGMAAHTGADCIPWAGDRQGRHCTAQGNMLVSSETVESMVSAFESSEGELPERLVKALAAGQAAGGDSRGQQSAALLVVRSGGGIGGGNDRYVDLRVDDHDQPIAELDRVLKVWRASFANEVTINRGIAMIITAALRRAGLYKGPVTDHLDNTAMTALNSFIAARGLSDEGQLPGTLPKPVFTALMGAYRGGE